MTSSCPRRSPAEAIRAATALLPTCGEAYRRGNQHLRREYNQAWFKAIYISADGGNPRISRVERTEPMEAYKNATVYDEPQAAPSVFERVLANGSDAKALETKERSSLRYRVLTHLPGISHVGVLTCHFWWS